METVEKLKFEYVETDLNGGNHWRAKNFKVVYYDYPKPHYSSYYAVKKLREGNYQFGMSCFHDKKNESMQYQTKEEAFKACENYLNQPQKERDISGNRTITLRVRSKKSGCVIGDWKA